MSFVSGKNLNKQKIYAKFDEFDEKLIREIDDYQKETNNEFDEKMLKEIEGHYDLNEMEIQRDDPNNLEPLVQRKYEEESEEIEEQSFPGKLKSVLVFNFVFIYLLYFLFVSKKNKYYTLEIFTLESFSSINLVGML